MACSIRSTSSGSAVAADVEADAGQRHHPALGGAGEQHRVARRPGPAGGVADGGDRRRPVAVGPLDVAAQQRQLGSLAGADLVGDERGDPLDPRRGILEGADVDRVLAGAQPGGHAHVPARRASRPRAGGGRGSPATTAARRCARWPRRRGGGGRGGGCGPRRLRIAWPIRAWGTTSRPAPSSTSRPAATAASEASSRSSPSSPLASARIGRVAAGPATAARLSTCTTRGSRRSRRRPIIARIDSGSSPPIVP